ncbi:uncharacterized protein LOC128727201 [Anopheles nili]|uniref:uncharacterized protein LOC128727201 n=1 Tax=Anopheles nili TaxID=185578 RepID=UPI00237C0840|nr:uncharacterized protein LOC128727201 [Anopheles nili]
MPFALVETTDVLGSKELVAAPETWIQRREGGKAYLCWPNVRNITTLNTLLSDENSMPSMMWEKHECQVKLTNILTLSSAGKMIESFQSSPSPSTTVQRRSKQMKPEISVESIQRKEPTSDQWNIVTVEQSLKDNIVEEVSSCIANEQSTDSFEELKTVPQIMDMFNDLKALIERNQDETRKKLNDGFFRLQKTLLPLVEGRSGSEITGTDCLPQDNSIEFHVNPLTSIEEMNDFEERLGDEDYRRQVYNWIDCTVGYEHNPEIRMMEILDLLFDKKFLPAFSWTGVSKGTKKRAMVEYKNIVRLFEHAGTTNTHRASHRYVASFFMKKLRYASARVSIRGFRRCVPHSMRSFRKRAATTERTRETDGNWKSVIKLENIQPTLFITAEEESE